MPETQLKQSGASDQKPEDKTKHDDHTKDDAGFADTQEHSDTLFVEASERVWIMDRVMICLNLLLREYLR